MHSDTSDVPVNLWWLWLVGLPAATTLAYRLLVPQRPDYAGHHLAGFAATLPLVWWTMRWLARWRYSAVAAAALSIALGAACEASLFAISGFDGADFFSQSQGAAQAGLALECLRPAVVDGDAALWRFMLILAAAAFAVGVGYAFA